jgi:hypothetical protein
METLSQTERVALLGELGRYILDGGPELRDTIDKTYRHNPWFTPENQEAALWAIAQRFLDPLLLEKWLSAYPRIDRGHDAQVALVLAGNLPLVGFHDWLCVFLSGLRAQIKLSEKDPYLMPHLLGMLGQWHPGTAKSWSFVDRLHGFDAVIATGSNNSARYFEYYFAQYPHIIRKNRNAVAVLTGEETISEMQGLGRDIFQYFGLGCRNVSKLYLPRGYDFEPLLEVLHEFREIVLHHKYKHNYDYNYALFLLNRVPFKMNGCVLLTESTAIPSRIAALNYSYYENISGLETELKARQDEIQCICASESVAGLPVVPFGKAQEPTLADYADGVDTMAFLGRINGV